MGRIIVRFQGRYVEHIGFARTYNSGLSGVVTTHDGALCGSTAFLGPMVATTEGRDPTAGSPRPVCEDCSAALRDLNRIAT